MYEKILELILQVNADITLSDTAKAEITSLLDNCSSDQELQEIQKSLSDYWQTTEPIIAHAMERKTPDELKKIQQIASQMVTGSRGVVEKSVHGSDLVEADSLISSF